MHDKSGCATKSEKIEIHVASHIVESQPYRVLIIIVIIYLKLKDIVNIMFKISFTESIVISMYMEMF